MGRRGPAPTPSAILKLRGSRKLENRKGEPKPHRGAPTCPSWLDTDAKAVWKNLAPKLDAMGVLTLVDQHALARYCHLWVQWRTAEAFIKENGFVYPLKDEKGDVRYVQQWPQVSIANKLAQLLARSEAEFGLTPASRARISVDPKGAETGNKLDTFLRLKKDA